MRAATRAALLGAVLLLPCGARAESAALRLEVEETATPFVVDLVFENVSGEPQRVYIDARAAEVEAYGEGRRLLRCQPAARARRDGAAAERFVSLQPGQRVRDPLDLRFQCFGRQLARLSEARRLRVSYRARIGTDRLGRRAWTGRIGPAEVHLARRNAAAPQDGEPQDSGEEAILSLRNVGSMVDAADGAYVPVTLELGAPPGTRVSVVIRPELFAFDVVGPGQESTTCQLPQQSIRPLREFFDSLGRRRITLDLGRLCRAGEISAPGIYEVRPSFQTSYGGEDAGLEAWTGNVEGESFLLRVRNPPREANEPVEIEWGRAPPPDPDQVVRAD